MAATDYWVIQMRHWDEDGTTHRLSQARRQATPVKVRRSNGDVSWGVIDTFGFGGRSVQVQIVGDDGKLADLYKRVDTERFLEINPRFGRSYIELTPEGDLS